MTCSYLPQYAGVYGEEHSVTSGMMLTLSGQTQVLRGMDAPYLEETLYTTQTEVAAVVYELEAAVWPLSDTGGKGGITILSGYPLVSSVYPKASTRMSAEQSKHFRVASQLFYPDCYGKTYLALWQGEQGGEVSEDLKKVTDFAAKFDFTVENYALENQKLWESGRNASAVDLMMGLNMLLITVMLLANLMTAAMRGAASRRYDRRAVCPGSEHPGLPPGLGRAVVDPYPGAGSGVRWSSLPGRRNPYAVLPAAAAVPGVSLGGPWPSVHRCACAILVHSDVSNLASAA